MTSENDRQNTPFPYKTIVKGLITIAGLVAIALAIRYSPLSHMLETGWIDEHIRGQGLGGWLIYLGTASLFISIGFPRQIICFLGGYAFGFVNGTLTAQAVTFAGSCACFLLARSMRSFIVHDKFRGRVEKVDRFLRENTFTMTLIIRLSPVGNNLLTNILAGISSVSGVRFLAGSFLGYLPQTVIFALLGSGFQVDLVLRSAISVALFLVSTVLGVYLYRKVRRGQHDDPL